jgi:phage terminase large subunit-like protein
VSDPVGAICVPQPSQSVSWVKELIKQRPLKRDEAEAASSEYVFGARESFEYFRCLMRPGMITSWWTKEIAQAMQQFYEDLIAGKRPMLAIGSPPQHGKSWAATDLIAWIAGKNPDLKAIYASYSDELGTRTNVDLQRMMQAPQYKLFFPGTRVGVNGWQCNTSLIEYAGRFGSFRNTTTMGSINGMELHLGVIDDPVKGRAEASSKTTRERLWNWFTDDWGSRFAANAGMVVVMTRWHVDDVLGRFIERSGDRVRVLDYPAIAEQDEPHRKIGEALFPELKPLSFLEERKKLLTIASWESLYQQHPIVVGGGILPIEKLLMIPNWDRSMVAKSVRYWDKAGTQDGGAHTAGVLLHKLHDGRFVIEHVVRGQWGALDREQQIKQWAEQDTRMLRDGDYEIGVEQEPGSGGKESAEASLRMLSGYRCYADKVTGSKEIRAEPFAAQVQGGNVYLLAVEGAVGMVKQNQPSRYVSQHRVSTCNLCPFSGHFSRDFFFD